MSNVGCSAEDRIRGLLDADSFVELGGYVFARNTDYNLGAKKVKGDGVITGYGVIGDRMVYVYSQDASALGGSVGEMHAKKIASLYDMAMKTGAPVIGMLDCAGLRLQEAGDALHAFGRIFRKQAQASGMIPQIAAVFGMCGGGSAVMTGLSDFVFMEKDKGSLFVNSPNALEGNFEDKNNTAGSLYQSEKAGNVDFVCEGEEDMLQKIRQLISFLPSDYKAEDAYEECRDDLNRIIPELGTEEYDAGMLLRSIADQNDFLETKAMTAGEMVTGFLRLNGETVGAVACQPSVNGGTMGYRGLKKAASFVRFCDAFSIPLLTVTNTTGFTANSHEERNLTASLAEWTSVMAQCSVPRINLITGNAWGTAAVVMNSRAIGADFVLAWPDARVGMMDSSQAIRIIYADEISDMDDPMALIREKTTEYDQLQNSAMAAAQRGYIDDIIEPDATRKRLIAAFEMLYGKKETPVAKKHSAV